MAEEIGKTISKRTTVDRAGSAVFAKHTYAKEGTVEIDKLREHIGFALERQRPSFQLEQHDDEEEGGWCRVTSDTDGRQFREVRLNKLECFGKGRRRRGGATHAILPTGEFQEEPPTVRVYNDGRCVCALCWEEVCRVTTVNGNGNGDGESSEE